MVQVPADMTAAFLAAEEVVGRYFADQRQDPRRGTIEVAGDRYVLIRAASLSVEFLTLVQSLFGEGREDEANAFAWNILFDLAHAIGKSDARNFHARMQLTDPIARLSAGPVHFAYSGWASVEIDPSSRPVPGEDFFLAYDHPYSFEAAAWLASARTTTFPACIMNAGYSSGWCEESFGIELVACELLCRARGDEACRFVMAHPSRIEAVVNAHKPAQAERAHAGAQGTIIPDFFARKRIEEELRRSRDELEQRVKTRTAELELANRQLVEEMAQRADAEQRLAQAQKLEAVGRLAGGVAHDFNNLLAVILARAEMVQARVSPDDRAVADMQAIQNACQQGASLTRHLMAFSRHEPITVRALAVGELVRSFSRGLLSLLGEDVEMQLELDADEMCVLADSAQLEQVLINVCVNARDAMPEGGKLTIQTSSLHTAGRMTATGAIAAGRYLALRVTDAGVGMDAQTVARMFDPFFSTRANGTGLGLSTVYGIVRRLGGGVDVESAPGSGTSITILLPCTDRDADVTPATAPLPIVRGSARILLVEDQDALRATLSVSLAEAGYDVTALGDPRAAVRLASETAFDVLLTDLVMPGMSGRELAAAVCKSSPQTRVLYMSGYEKPTDSTASHPPARVLQKPFALGEVTAALDALLDNRR